MKKNLAGGIIAILITSALAVYIWHCSHEDEMSKFRNRQVTKPILFDAKQYQDERTYVTQHCPAKEELVKQNNGIWVTKDSDWLSHTHSAATKVLEFIGAQWIGIAHKGQVMCMYRTNEPVAFTLNLEPKNSTLVPEPANLANWSALIDGRYRICRSVNVTDCNYQIERPLVKSREDIMHEIRWQPKAARNNH